MFMRRTLITLAVLAIPILAHAWPRLGQHSQLMIQDTGTNTTYIAVALSSNTATLIYSGNNDDREITLQNPNATYDVYIGSHSNVLGSVSSTNPSLKIPKGNGTYTLNNTANIYAITEAAGSGVTLLGSVEYDTED